MPLQDFPPAQTVTNPVFPGGTQGNILFFGAGATVSQSNSLFWDNVIGTFKVPGSQLGTFAAGPTIGGFSPGTDNFRLGEGRALGNPTGSVVATPSGGGLTGTYKYAYVEYDVDRGQTGLSPQTTVVAAANQYTLTVPLQRRGTICRAVVRTKANGSTFFLLHDFLSGEQSHCTQWVDNVADGSLGAAVVDADTTLMYKAVGNKDSDFGGMFLCTHPDQTGKATDLTVLCAGIGVGDGAADFYGAVNARGVTTPCYTTIANDTSSIHVRYRYQTALDSGAASTNVFQMNGRGDVVWTPVTFANPTWMGLTGGVAGNYYVARKGASNSQAGLYVGAAFEPYFGSNINYSSGDTYSAGTIPPWRLGNASGSTTIPFKVDVAAVGSAAAAITWVNAVAIDTSGNVGFNQAIPRRQVDILNASSPQLRLTFADNSSYTEFQVNTSGYMNIIASGNRVGVNQASPTDVLEVMGAKNSSTSLASGGLVVTDSTSAALGTGGVLLFMGAYTGTTKTQAAAIQAYKTNSTGGNFSFDMVFHTRANSSGNLGAGVFRLTDQGSVIVGTAALATTVTDGFPYIPTCAGTPTGVPTTFTGRSPYIIDTTAGKFWAYYGGAWHFTTFT